MFKTKKGKDFAGYFAEIFGATKEGVPVRPKGFAYAAKSGLCDVCKLRVRTRYAWLDENKMVCGHCKNDIVRNYNKEGSK